MAYSNLQNSQVMEQLNTFVKNRYQDRK